MRFVPPARHGLGAGFTNGLLIFFGTLSILVAAGFIVFQRDAKRLLAYHSVEHLGIITLGYGLGPLGTFAALFHTLNHSVCKSLAFFAVGRLGQQFGSHENEGGEMRQIAAFLLAILWVMAMAPSNASAQPASEGHPHKWVTVEKSLFDYLTEGFELKAVVYDTSETGAKPALPDVNYFLQKSIQLVRCDFRKRGETSYYWCAQLARPN